MTTMPTVIRCPDKTALTIEATGRIIGTLKEAIAQRGYATMALAGGGSPIPVYRAMADHQDVNWSKCLFFAGDDRFVPADSPFNNCTMMTAELINNIDGARFFPIDSSLPSPAAAADAYARTMDKVFDTHELPRHNQIPVFDIILLGIGPDGHTASLFPGTNALTETQQWVTSIPMSGLEPFVPRVTITYPLINAARNAIILVNGTTKTAIAEAIVGGHQTDYPVAAVHSQAVHWLLAP